MPVEVRSAKRLRYQMTERLDVGDGAEINDLVTEAVDASADDTATTENIISPSLPSKKQNTYARLQASLSIEDNLLLAPNLPAS